MRLLTTAFFTIALLSVSELRIASQTKIDLVIVNANVRTLDQRNTRGEAIAVAGNRIAAVGTNIQIRKLIGPNTKTIDAKGHLVLPGFNDAHVHFAAIGNKFSSISLQDVKSPEELRQRLAYYVKFLPKGRWILGSGWDNSNWQPNTPPSKELIDGVTTNNPVFIYHSDGKSALANSIALHLAAERTTPSAQSGGHPSFVRRGALGTARNDGIQHNADGEPTGIVRDRAMQIVASVIPQDHTKDWLEIIQTASNYAASLGVTSIQDMHSDDLADIYRELEQRGKLKTRVYDCVALSDWAKKGAAVKPAAETSSLVRTGCVKSFSDGDEGSIPRLKREIAAADKAGLQVMIHAIGAKPNELVLTIFEHVAKENGRRARRFRVEHAHDFRTEDASRFGRSKIIASMQPYLFYGGNSLDSNTFLYLTDRGASLAFGSDAPITDFNPLLGIHAAVAPNRFSVDEAVRAYTVGSAYAEFQEKVKGTIEVGKLADLVILSDDIFFSAVQDIRSTMVLTTIVDGKVIYER